MSNALPERSFSSEKRPFEEPADLPPVDSSPSIWSYWFGGRNVPVGPRIGPVLESISLGDGDSELESHQAILEQQKNLEDGHAIQYRTCSWQKVGLPNPSSPNRLEHARSALRCVLVFFCC